MNDTFSNQNDATIVQKYNQWHAQMATHEEQNILNLPWYKTVDEVLPDLNGKDVLEVGCGRGVFAHYLALRYPQARIVAVDFSPEAIQVANKTYADVSNIHFQVADAEQLPFESGTFDYYISCETIEHVLHPPRMINEIYRVLRGAGSFVLTTENYFNAYLLVWLKCWLLKRPFESGCGTQPHENFFIFPMLLGWFRSSHLRVTQTRSNHYQWLVWPGVAPAKLCTFDVQQSALKWLFKPFGRHFTYLGSKL